MLSGHPGALRNLNSSGWKSHTSASLLLSKTHCMNTYEALYVMNPKQVWSQFTTILSSRGWGSRTFFKPFTLEAAATIVAGRTIQTGSQWCENMVDFHLNKQYVFTVNNMTRCFNTFQFGLQITIKKLLLLWFFFFLYTHRYFETLLGWAKRFFSLFHDSNTRTSTWTVGLSCNSTVNWLSHLVWIEGIGLGPSCTLEAPRRPPKTTWSHLARGPRVWHML